MSVVPCCRVDPLGLSVLVRLWFFADLDPVQLERIALLQRLVIVSLDGAAMDGHIRDVFSSQRPYTTALLNRRTVPEDCATVLLRTLQAGWPTREQLLQKCKLRFRDQRIVAERILRPVRRSFHRLCWHDWRTFAE